MFHRCRSPTKSSRSCSQARSPSRRINDVDDFPGPYSSAKPSMSCPAKHPTSCVGGSCDPARPVGFLRFQRVELCHAATHLRKKHTFRTVKRTNEPELRELQNSYVRFPCRMSPSCLVGLAIVVVEDHDDARRYLDLFLRQLGAKVMVAGNAFEGLELIKHSRPDLA